MVHPFSIFSGTFSPFIQDIYGGTFCPSKLPPWNIDLGTLLSTKLPVQKIHRGWHPRKNSQRAEWPPINPSIHPLFHPSPACWISTQLDSRERALAEQTHGWNYTQLYNRERALAADARLKPENQFDSRLDAGFVHKQRGSEQAGRQT